VLNAGHDSIQIIAVCCRVITASAGFIMLGLPTLLYMIWPLRIASTAQSPAWCKFHRNALTTLWLVCGINLVAGLAWLIFAVAGLIGGPMAEICSNGVALTVAEETTFGRALIIHAVLATLCLGVLTIGHGRLRLGTLLVLATINTCVLVGVGHAVEPWGDTNLLPLAADLVHRLAAGFWLGSIAGFTLLLATSRDLPSVETRNLAECGARAFWPLGIACVIAMLISGGFKSYMLVGDIPHLLGTDYGRLLVAKIGLFAIMISMAVQNRKRWTPWLLAGDERSGRALAGLRRNCRFELALGMTIVIAAGVLASMTPGAHQDAVWPLSIRWDLDMLGKPSVANGLAIALTFTGLALLTCSIVRRRLRLIAGLSGAMLVLVFLPTPIHLITVPAYPTTFKDSPVPYDADSIADGLRLYRIHCEACHGADFKGSGDAGAVLPVKPADLTAPHVLGHPPGDLFWWIGNGIPEGGMPAFSGVLSDTQRWNLVNFVRTLPVGGLPDGLSEVVAPNAPQAPNFSFEVQLGVQEELSDRLKNGPMVLVLLDNEPPARLTQLEGAGHAIEASGIGFLAVTSDRRGYAGTLPFVALVDTSVSSAYGMLASGRSGAAAEFLIDRAGFARAAWRADRLPNWAEPSVLDHLSSDLIAHPMSSNTTQHHH
jgi:putative copper export protein/mono/diheme cytochrome c family protein